MSSDCLLEFVNAVNAIFYPFVLHSGIIEFASNIVDDTYFSLLDFSYWTF